MTNIPWVEKYRPSNFKDIVLEKNNALIFKNIIEKKYFPNLLFYGPPGTGKTTTIINLINRYLESQNIVKKKDLIIHLNASDDRGVDIVRNQINQFVNTKTLFNTGLKFIILDEVDYMTKNAQCALRYLIQQYSTNIRFCLICNYISRIDYSLQNEFIRLKFCNLPESKITEFLNNIVKKENLKINKETLKSIQQIFKSDMRSMINYLQSNNNFLNDETNNIISNDFWNELIQNYFEKQETIVKTTHYIRQSSITYNIRINNLIVKFISFVILNKKYSLNEIWLTKMQSIIHFIDTDENDVILTYFVISFLNLYKS